MSATEVEALSEAIARRLTDAIVDRVGWKLEQMKTQIEGTLGAEADRIARQIIRKLEPDA